MTRLLRNGSFVVFLVAASLSSTTTRVVEAGNECYQFFASCEFYEPHPPNGHLFLGCDECPDFEQQQCCSVVCGGPYFAQECSDDLKDCEGEPSCAFCVC
jgi:hypothetical protein